MRLHPRSTLASLNSEGRLGRHDRGFATRRRVALYFARHCQQHSGARLPPPTGRNAALQQFNLELPEQPDVLMLHRNILVVGYDECLPRIPNMACWPA